MSKRGNKGSVYSRFSTFQLGQQLFRNTSIQANTHTHTQTHAHTCRRLIWVAKHSFYSRYHRSNGGNQSNQLLIIMIIMDVLPSLYSSSRFLCFFLPFFLTQYIYSFLFLIIQPTLHFILCISLRFLFNYFKFFGGITVRVMKVCNCWV